jgi:hypothetical protein
LALRKSRLDQLKLQLLSKTERGKRVAVIIGIRISQMIEMEMVNFGLCRVFISFPGLGLFFEPHLWHT